MSIITKFDAAPMGLLDPDYRYALHRMSEPPLRSYAVTGRYNGDTTVQESKG